MVISDKYDTNIRQSPDPALVHSQVCRPIILVDVGLLRMVLKKTGPRSFQVMANPGDIPEKPGMIGGSEIGDILYFS